MKQWSNLLFFQPILHSYKRLKTIWQAFALYHDNELSLLYLQDKLRGPDTCYLVRWAIFLKQNYPYHWSYLLKPSKLLTFAFFDTAIQILNLNQTAEIICWIYLGLCKHIPSFATWLGLQVIKNIFTPILTLSGLKVPY